MRDESSVNPNHNQGLLLLRLQVTLSFVARRSELALASTMLFLGWAAAAPPISLAAGDESMFSGRASFPVSHPSALAGVPTLSIAAVSHRYARPAACGAGFLRRLLVSVQRRALALPSSAFPQRRLRCFLCISCADKRCDHCLSSSSAAFHRGSAVSIAARQTWRPATPHRSGPWLPPGARSVPASVVPAPSSTSGAAGYAPEQQLLLPLLLLPPPLSLHLLHLLLLLLRRRLAIPQSSSSSCCS